MEVMVGKDAGQRQGGWSHVRRCRSTSRVRDENTDDTRSHRLPGAWLLVGSIRNWSVSL